MLIEQLFIEFVSNVKKAAENVQSTGIKNAKIGPDSKGRQ